MAPTLSNYIRDVKTEVNAYPADMDMNVIDSERRIAYGVLAMLVAIWFIGVLVVRFCGGRDEPDAERGVGVAFKDLSSSEATTQASSQLMARAQAQGVETRDTEKGKGRAEG